MNCNGFGRNRSSYHPSIILQFCLGTERNTKRMFQAAGVPGQDTNRIR